MKNKILALLATIGLVSSASAIEINDNLSINGFIDGSYQAATVKSTIANVAQPDAEASVFGIDEVELDFLFNNGNVSGEVHVDTEDADQDQGVSVEQAFVTYNFDSGISATFGRKGLNSGFEREDPAGLYTFSRSYDVATAVVSAFTDGVTTDLGNVDAYQLEGLELSYSADTFSAGVYFFQQSDANLETNDLQTELFVNYSGIDNLNLFLGYIMQDDLTIGGLDAEVDVLNIHASYTIDKLLLAAEYTNLDSKIGTTSGDDEAYMVLANYSINNQLGATVRYSKMEELADKFTIAGSYQLTNNLGAIIEYSDIDDDLGVAGNSISADSLAVELTYTF